MNVVVSTEAREFIEDRGGVLYVRPNNHRCCAGTLTLLDSSTARPSDSARYISVASEGVDIMYQSRSAERPKEIVIELRGRWRRRPVVHWDGCAYRP